MTTPQLDSTGPNSDDAELWDLENLAAARRLAAWMFAPFAPLARGRVVEVGAGLGTFTQQLLDHGASSVLALEPHPRCVARLRKRFGDDPRVTVSDASIPGSGLLAADTGHFDFALCQNVLEHIEDDFGAVAEMGDALAIGGSMGLLVPAHPWLYGRLDELYGHHRRYTRARLLAMLAASDLEVVSVYRFNALGVAGWLAKRWQREPRLDATSLRVYEGLLSLYRPLESRVRVPLGLSLIAHARRVR